MGNSQPYARPREGIRDDVTAQATRLHKRKTSLATYSWNNSDAIREGRILMNALDLFDCVYIS